MFEVFILLLRNLTLITAVAMVYTILPKRQEQVPESLIVGIVCGLGACLAMLDPVPLGPGVFVDSRSTMILLAGLFGGPISSLVSVSLAVGLRIYLGGAGAAVGSLSIALAGAIGVAVYLVRHIGSRPVQFSDVLVLAAASPFTFLPVLLLPEEPLWNFIREALLPTALLRVVGVVFLGILLVHERRRLRAEERIRELAGTDELSGLANRRKFYRALDLAVAGNSVEPFNFAVLLIDLDRFKSINDQYGHPVGDEVIKRLAQILRENIREGDVAARIGGEEFAVLLAGANREEAKDVAERIRASVEDSPVTVEGGHISFTASLGVAASLPFHRPAKGLMSAADSALYSSKQSGRNRVTAEAIA